MFFKVLDNLQKDAIVWVSIGDNPERGRKMTEKIYRAGLKQGEGDWTWWAFDEWYAKQYGGELIESEIESDDDENLPNSFDLRQEDFDADRDMDSDDIKRIYAKHGLEIEIKDGIFLPWQLQDVGDFASYSNFAEKIKAFDYILWYEDGHATIGIRNK